MLSWQLRQRRPGRGRGHRRALALGQDRRAARGDDRLRLRRRLRRSSPPAGRWPARPRRPRPRPPPRCSRSRRWSPAAAAPGRLRRPARGGRDDDPDRRLGARGRRRRGRGRPGPAAEHRPARVRAAPERHRGRGRRRAGLRQRRRARRMDRRGRLRQRQRRRGRRPRRRRSRTACPASRAGRRGLALSTRTGGTTPATPRPRCARSSADWPPPTPRSAAEFEAQRRRATSAELRGLDRGIAALHRPPSRRAQRKLVTDHDAFGYFAHRYGIEVVGAVIPSQTTQAQPSAKDLERAGATTIEAEGVRAIFPESSLSPKVAEAIARQTGATAGGTLYGDTLGPRRVERRHLPGDGAGERRRDGRAASPDGRRGCRVGS